VSASAITVHLPGDADPGAVQSAWYADRPAEAFAALNPTGEGVTVDSRTVRVNIDGLESNVGPEVRVQFPHGLVTAAPPPWQANADRADVLTQAVAPIGTFLALLLTVAILAGGGAFLLWLWFTNGRDPAIGAVPPRLEQPPSDLPAPLAGTLVDEIAGAKEVVAALVDMGDRGLLQLTDMQNPQLVGSTSHVRVILRAPLEDARLRGYEKALLAALFGRSPTVPAEMLLSTVKQHFPDLLPPH
jgi:hypothetical protein